MPYELDPPKQSSLCFVLFFFKINLFIGRITHSRQEHTALSKIQMKSNKNSLISRKRINQELGHICFPI